MPSDVNATFDRDMHASLARGRAKAEPAPPLPRSVGLMLAFGVSLAMWGALIEGGVRLWSVVGGSR